MNQEITLEQLKEEQKKHGLCWCCFNKKNCFKGWEYHKVCEKSRNEKPMQLCLHCNSGEKLKCIKEFCPIVVTVGKFETAIPHEHYCIECRRKRIITCNVINH